MLEVRYASNPTPRLLLAGLALGCAAWKISYLIYSVVVIYPPTSTVVIKLLGWLVVLVFGLSEIIVWYRRRNVIVLKISAAGIWNAHTGLLAWEVVDLNIYRWHDTVSLTYDNPQGTHLLKWNLTDLNTSASELTKAKEVFNSN